MKKILTVLAFVFCAWVRADDFGTDATAVSALHITTNYLITVLGDHEMSVVRKINPSNLVAVQNTVILPRTNLAGVINHKAVVNVPVNLSFSGTNVAVDASLAMHFRLTLTNSALIGAPTNGIDNQKVEFELLQDATGGHLLFWETNSVNGFSFGTDLPHAACTLTTTASKTDYFTAQYKASSQRWYVKGMIKGF